MIQNKKRIISLILMLTLLVSSLVVGAITASAEGTYEKATSIAAGDTVVLVCESKKMELNGISTTSTKYGLGVAYTSAPTGAYALTVEEGSTSGTYSFKAPNGQYLYWTSGNSLATNATKNAKTSWTVTFSGGNAVIKNSGDSTRQIFWNSSSPRFACYNTTSQNAVQLYKLANNTSDGEGGGAADCEHANTVPTEATPATCTEVGYTAGKFCNDCETYTEGHVEIPATGHEKTSSVIVKATCTTPGSETVTCDKCEAVVSVTTIPALAYRFEKVTEGLNDWTGTYLIVYTNGTEYFAFNGGLETLDAVSNSISVSVSDGIIAADNNTLAAVFDVEKYGESYTLKSASEYYIGKTAYSNGLDSKKDTKYSVTFAIDGENAVITASGGTVLRYNAASDQNRFRFYKSGQKDVQLYKLITGDHTYVDGKCSACGHEAETFEEAITGTGTITLTKDVNYGEADFIISSAVTINLNGHNITAAGVITFDPATRFVGEGKLVIPQDRIVLAGEADHMAVWVGDGYVFNQVKDQYKSEVTGDDSFNVVFRPSFGSTEYNKTILGGNTNAGLTFELQIWNGENKVFAGTLNADIVKQAYAENGAISIRVNSAPAGTYTVKLVIKSTMGLTNTADLGTITIPVVEEILEGN